MAGRAATLGERTIRELARDLRERGLTYRRHERRAQLILIFAEDGDGIEHPFNGTTVHRIRAQINALPRVVRQ